MPLKENKCNLLNLKGKMELKLFNTTVDTAKTQKDLGILMCDNLSWSVNAENRISIAMGVFLQNQTEYLEKTSLKSKLNLYCGCIVPIISYASQTWHPNKETRQTWHPNKETRKHGKETRLNVSLYHVKTSCYSHVFYRQFL